MYNAIWKLITFPGPTEAKQKNTPDIIIVASVSFPKYVWATK